MSGYSSDTVAVENTLTTWTGIDETQELPDALPACPMCNGTTFVIQEHWEASEVRNAPYTKELTPSGPAPVLTLRITTRFIICSGCQAVMASFIRDTIFVRMKVLYAEAQR